MPEEARPKGPLTYEEKKFVGTFEVAAGVHEEGGVVYRRGEKFRSKSDLRAHNFPGATKFIVHGPVDEAAVKHNNQGLKRNPRLYQPENPQTLPPKDKREFDRTGMVPAQTLEGDKGAMGANTSEGSESDEVQDGTGDNAQGGGDEIDFDTMTLAQLRDYADTEEIELHGATRKDDVLDTVKKARRRKS
jgi:hypothetical protein